MAVEVRARQRPSDGQTISPSMLRSRLTQPNTLIFVDFPCDDPEASGKFYAEVFGWEVEGRPTGEFHRIVPGGHFPLADGTDSTIGNLHMGIYNIANARPHPDPAGVEPRTLATQGRTARVWILVSDDDSEDASSRRRSSSARRSCGGITTGPSSTASTARSKTRGVPRWCCGPRAGPIPSYRKGWTHE